MVWIIHFPAETVQHSYEKNRKPDLSKQEAGLYKFRSLFFFRAPAIFANEENNILFGNWSGMETQGKHVIFTQFSYIKGNINLQFSKMSVIFLLIDKLKQIWCMKKLK